MIIVVLFCSDKVADDYVSKLANAMPDILKKALAAPISESNVRVAINTLGSKDVGKYPIEIYVIGNLDESSHKVKIEAGIKEAMPDLRVLRSVSIISAPTL